MIRFQVGHSSAVAAGLDDRGSALDACELLRAERTRSHYEATVEQAERVLRSLEGCPAHAGSAGGYAGVGWEVAAVRRTARALRRKIEEARAQ